MRFVATKLFVITATLGLLLTCNGFGLAPTGHRHSVDFNAEESKSFGNDSRRSFFSSLAGFSLVTTMFPTGAAFAGNEKVLILGGSGFVGSRIVRQLKSMGVDVVATSRNGRDGTTAFDVSKGGNIAAEVERLASGCSAVISTIGAIGTPKDGPVNAASGLASNGAKAAGVKRFVYISVAPEVREATKGVGFLEDYMKGKTFSEDSIKYNFGGEGTSFTLIEPTFIYGGDGFSLNPPRVAGGYGKLVEGLLSSGPFRAAAGVSPGIVGVALEPPVPVETVAAAAIAGALGKSGSILDTYDKINEAAKQV